MRAQDWVLVVVVALLMGAAVGVLIGVVALKLHGG